MSPSFVLVHGAWHDARAWDQLRRALGERGCGSVAVDLPIDEIGVDASGYARVIAGAVGELSGDPEPPVVIGHSMSGIAIPLVPALASVRRPVFLAALIPSPGRTMAEVQTSENVLGDTSAVARDASARSFWTSPDAAVEVLYHDCNPVIAGVAAARLRPQARAPHDEPCPLTCFPDVPVNYVVMQSDRMIRPEWSRTAARARLGTEPVELPGGHSPMLADPERLAETLIALTRADAREYVRRQ
jgi:pimeloyl-ACP methyl ester carboxylesterase